MNLFNAGLVAVVLGAAGVSAVTVGDLQGALCSPGVEALGEEQFSTLVAALDAAKDVELGDIPPNQNLVLVAPTNDAFAAALKALNVTAEALLSDTDTLASILSVHVGFAESPEATTAVDVAKSSLMFMVDGQESSLESTWPVDGEQVAGVSIMGPVNTADVASVIRCVGGEQTLFAADSVLLPESLAPTPTPTPTPTPPTPAGSAPATSMLVSAGALVLGALQFL